MVWYLSGLNLVGLVGDGKGWYGLMGWYGLIWVGIGWYGLVWAPHHYHHHNPCHNPHHNPELDLKVVIFVTFCDRQNW